MTRLDLSARRLEPELMDEPGLDQGRHLRALRALARINRVSFGADRVWDRVVRIQRERLGPVRVLDVACGGGDILTGVGARAQRNGLDVVLHGCDVSPVAVEAARTRTVADERFDFFEHDALAEPLPDAYDLVCSSLFLHHLAEAQAIALLRAMAAATAHTVFVQDLRRTRLGYLFAFVGLHTLTRSDVARVDGLLSVRAAFTLREADALCEAAGLAGGSVRPCWPQRFTIDWRRR